MITYRAWTKAFVCLGSLGLLSACADVPARTGGRRDAQPVKTTAHLGDEPFRFAVLDVGQGDALAVIAPDGCASLIDGGPAGAGGRIKSYLHDLGIASLDFAVVSHYHADHLGGLSEVEQGSDSIPIEAIYDRGGQYSTDSYRRYAAHFAGRRTTVQVGQVLSLCDQVELEVVGVNANGVATTDENALSVVVQIRFGDLGVLAGGDLTGSSPNVESEIAASLEETEVYKVHHHGSRNSSNQEFLDALSPLASLISCGLDNFYGHPHDETVSRLHGVGSDIWQTEDEGQHPASDHIEVTSMDGMTFAVAKGDTSAEYASRY